MLKIMTSRTDFYDQFRILMIRYKNSGYNQNIKRQSLCSVISQITLDNFASLITSCTQIGRA